MNERSDALSLLSFFYYLEMLSVAHFSQLLTQLDVKIKDFSSVLPFSKEIHDLCVRYSLVEAISAIILTYRRSDRDHTVVF